MSQSENIIFTSLLNYICPYQPGKLVHRACYYSPNLSTQRTKFQLRRSYAMAARIPKLPAKHDQFIQYIAAHPNTPMQDLLEPYKQYDTELRKILAQEPDHQAAKQPNVVPVFAGNEQDIKVRARDLGKESSEEKDKYIMPLKNEQRRLNDSLAIVPSLREFRTNFNCFSESSLVDLDFSNVVVAGSAVVTSLLAVPEKYAGSKRALRQYYHEHIAPASDVDLFVSKAYHSYSFSTDRCV